LRLDDNGTRRDANRDARADFYSKPDSTHDRHV
jgi:hypothetical protein